MEGIAKATHQVARLVQELPGSDREPDRYALSQVVARNLITQIHTDVARPVGRTVRLNDEALGRW